MRTQSVLAAAALGLGSGVAAYEASSGGSGGGKGVPYAGLNLAGCEFQCDVKGACTGGEEAKYFCPKPEQYKEQIAHFQKKYNHNIFRLPVGWQYIVGNDPAGKLGGEVWENFQGMVKECLASGSKCIIDVHNYGRWEGKEITGEAMEKSFADLWGAIAAKYASEKNIVFGIMNEPHDQDSAAWQKTCQKAVDAVRDAGAKDQWILVPGPPWSHLGDFAKDTSKYSLEIKDKADSSGKNLIIDLHQYFDEDNSGTHTECAGWDHVQAGFESGANKLAAEGRKGLISEIGGGNTESCVETMGKAFDFINEHSDVFLGWTGWAAGSFKDDYELVETPVGDEDRLIVKEIIGGKFKNPGTKTSEESPAKESPGQASPSPATPNTPADTPSSYGPSTTPAGGSSPTPSASPYGSTPSSTPSSPGPSGSPSPGGYNYPSSPKKPKNSCHKKPKSPASPQQYGPSTTLSTSVTTPTPSPNAEYHYPAKPDSYQSGGQNGNQNGDQNQQSQQNGDQNQQSQQNGNQNQQSQQNGNQSGNQNQQPQQYDSGSSGGSGSGSGNGGSKSYRKQKRTPYDSGSSVLGNIQKRKRSFLRRN
ncbi:MAG: hypothetical protein M1831_000893 [Alyxoria varia]|nr:MAG: hypothetical protein M1831_000893 [Alyxoria varia]